jgi:hypothetical protein
LFVPPCLAASKIDGVWMQNSYRLHFHQGRSDPAGDIKIATQEARQPLDHRRPRALMRGVLRSRDLVLSVSSANGVEQFLGVVADAIFEHDFDILDVRNLF